MLLVRPPMRALLAVVPSGVPLQMYFGSSVPSGPRPVVLLPADAMSNDAMSVDVVAMSVDPMLMSGGVGGNMVLEPSGAKQFIGVGLACGWITKLGLPPLISEAPPSPVTP